MYGANGCDRCSASSAALRNVPASFTGGLFATLRPTVSARCRTDLKSFGLFEEAIKAWEGVKVGFVVIGSRTRGIPL